MIGGEQVVLGVVVDHGLRQDLVLRVALGLLQMFVHKGGHLVHIEIDVRNLFRFNVIQAVQPGEDIPEPVVVALHRSSCHAAVERRAVCAGIFTRTERRLPHRVQIDHITLYSIQNQMTREK